MRVFTILVKVVSQIVSPLTQVVFFVHLNSNNRIRFYVIGSLSLYTPSVGIFVVVSTTFICKQGTENTDEQDLPKSNLILRTCLKTLAMSLDI